MRNIAHAILVWSWVALYAAVVGAATHYYSGNVVVTIVLTSLGAAWARWAVHTLGESSCSE